MANRIVQQGERVTVRARAAAGQTYTAQTDVYLDAGESLLISFPPPPRQVSPGENITTILLTDRNLSLKPGAHMPHQWPAGATGKIAFQSGAYITGGGVDVSGTTGVEYDGLRVQNALRCVWATDATNLKITNWDIGKDSSNGFYFRGLVTANIGYGLLHDVNRMIRNDATANNDFGAMGIDCHDTEDGSDIWVHDTRGKALRVADHATSSFNYSTTGTYLTPAPPLSRSFDYGLDEGCFVELWQSKGLRLGPRVTVEDVQVIVETGRSVSQNGPDCSFDIDGLLAFAGTKQVGRVMRGILARTAVESSIRHATLAGLTDWGITTATSASFGGNLDLVVQDVINVSPPALIRGRSAGVTMSHNFLAGTGVAGDFGPGANSKSGDPKFVNAAAFDYRLQSTSTAKGAAHDGSDMGAIW